MKVTYYGHSCFSVKLGERTILFDPFITPNDLASGIDLNTIKADYILISHAHEDHIADAVALARQTGATVVSNYEVTEWLKKQGVSAEKVHPMNHGGSWKFDFGNVKYVNAVHSSSFPDGSNGGNPGGFVINSAGGNLYFAGDTALTVDMQLIPRFATLDLAILPIGDNFTMGIDDAIAASEFINCDNVMGVHYDTFPYIKIDPADAQQKFKDAGKVLHLLKIGETRDI